MYLHLIKNCSRYEIIREQFSKEQLIYLTFFAFYINKIGTKQIAKNNIFSCGKVPQLFSCYSNNTYFKVILF